MSKGAKITSPLPIPASVDNDSIPTLNAMGFTTKAPDPYSRLFIQHAINHSSQEYKALEIGAAYGVSTIPVLLHGGHIIANDIDERHLKILEHKIPEKYRKNLHTIAGKFPDEIAFPENSIACILISRVMHFFDGKTIRTSLKNMYNWLIPGGKLFIVNNTAYEKYMRNEITPIYEERKQKLHEWPGYFDNFSDFFLRRHRANLPDVMHCLDPDILQRELNAINFNIEKVAFFARPKFLQGVSWDGRERVYAIASKPVNRW
ncbi:MAG: class I SAM-dependent methyltransferase [Pseudomonadota bacterium]